MTSLNLPPQVANAAPRFDEQAQVGAHLQVHFVAGRLEAHVRRAVLVHEPEAPAVGRRIAELELDDGAAGRHARSVDVAMHAPREEGDVEIVLVHVAAPALSPDRERIDDRGQLLARGVSVQLRGRPFFAGPRFTSPARSSCAQAPRQERRRDARHAAVDLVELRAAVDEAADDEQRPALAQQLDCERERTVLTVLVCHDSLSPRPGRGDQYRTASSGARRLRR